MPPSKGYSSATVHPEKNGDASDVPPSSSPLRLVNIPASRKSENDSKPNRSTRSERMAASMNLEHSITRGNAFIPGENMDVSNKLSAEVLDIFLEQIESKVRDAPL